jgi:hypothetical protein
MATDAPRAKVRSVVVEGLVLLRLIKHCHSNAHAAVSGTLLGLEVDGGICEVTNCFPSNVDGSV